MTSPIIAVVGLGYVGLPLALAFANKYRTIGFDVNAHKVAAYQEGIDPTDEVSAAEFKAATLITYTTDAADLAEADVIIVAVPTPVDASHNPDFFPLVSSSTNVGKHMKRGATVVYESTVYPGATEEICVPALERASGLKWKQDFFVGYSPERINPGDRERTLTKITKVISGDTPATEELLEKVYGSIIEAGIILDEQHPSRRGGKGHREYTARSEHRVDE